MICPHPFTARSSMRSIAGAVEPAQLFGRALHFDELSAGGVGDVHVHVARESSA